MHPITRLLTAFALVISTLCFAGEPMLDLAKSGTQQRLNGDFEAARSIEEQLLTQADDPIGHIFAINTIITHLTWDETVTDYDEALINHVDNTLVWCEKLLAEDDRHARANYYCGQANFALSYFHALRGRYYQSGRHGTRTIEFLEAALKEDPTLTDAKMHLGVAYYVADNLPPFVKMFSRLLWFIPTGNSEKSLPYLRDVIERGDHYPDVARYIYSTLLMEKAESRSEARAELQTLVTRYPENSRFQLRLVSLLIVDGDFDSALDSALAYMKNDPPEPDLSLAKIWLVRAYLGLNRHEEAAQLFNEVDSLFRQAGADLPGWSIAWHMLTDGQLHDLANRRRAARETYAKILGLAKSTYVNQVITDAAREGLLNPYRTVP